MTKEEKEQKRKDDACKKRNEETRVRKDKKPAKHFFHGVTSKLEKAVQNQIKDATPEEAARLKMIMETPIPKDPIQPSHYKDHPSGVECIEITRWANFNIGNVIKYLWRSGKKDPAKEIEDLKKAAWYLNDEIQRLEKISQQSS